MVLNINCRGMLCLEHFHNISQQILSGMLLMAITNEQKSNLSGEFKLKLITTCHIRIYYKNIMKIL